ncbi:hypothetical protein [Pseudoduganella chitinolytica]|uniref:Sel1 repeat family protein n=1 Tax=Pseudoduganella chitinolytica TaxID=34070 RepID=A0ABY8B5A1_9BURK|nr:hypothetical protein [Pseudoduganella chitinolytica]WEF31125.1 hypothetical protein PX653_16805 [Pseudoduganella chitinolytica]
MAPNSIPARRNTRAVVLLVSLMLIGGTGCLTMHAIDSVQRANRERATDRRLQQERDARVAAAAGRVAAGDPQAMTNVAMDLMDNKRFSGPDWERPLALLEQAAGKGYGPAQAVLGELLLSGRWQGRYFVYHQLPGGARIARGVELLKQATTRGCTFGSQGTDEPQFNVDPAARLVEHFERIKDAGQARLWRARPFVHCRAPNDAEVFNARYGHGTPEQRQRALALALLANDDNLVADVRKGLAPSDFAAAEQGAAELRRLVAASEQHYPAPPRTNKE